MKMTRKHDPLTVWGILVIISIVTMFLLIKMWDVDYTPTYRINQWCGKMYSFESEAETHPIIVPTGEVWVYISSYGGGQSKVHLTLPEGGDEMVTQFGPYGIKYYLRVTTK